MDFYRLMLIKSLCLNYPILEHWGFTLAKLISLIVPEGQTQALIRVLSCEDSIVITEAIRPTSVVKLLLQDCYSFVFFTYTPGKKNSEIIKSILVSTVLSGFIENKRFNARIILITENTFLSDPLQELFLISLESIRNIHLPIRSVVPEDNQLALVHDKIMNLNMDTEKDDVACILLAAACFLYPFSQESYDMTLSLAPLLCEEDRFMHEDSGVEQQFLEGLFTWRKETGFSEVSELPFILFKDAEGADIDPICYDDEFVFISEANFRKIINHLPVPVGSQAVKSGLKNNGLLVSEAGNQKTYAVKMSYTDETGPHRKYMLRFRRERLVNIDNCSFVNMCLIERSNEDDDED